MAQVRQRKRYGVARVGHVGALHGVQGELKLRPPEERA